MKVLVIGKYPPIEGGVSSSTYWFCRCLAESGNQVYVVSNAREVEASFKIHLEDNDSNMLEPDFLNKSGGFVKVHFTTPLKMGSYIPWAQPYVSKLAGLAIEIGELNKCEVIYSHYLEPYGVAAAIVAQYLSIPFILRHAGSDIGRLAAHPELKTIYKAVISKSQAIITPNSKVLNILEELGAEKKHIIIDRLHSIPTDYFNPNAIPLNTEILISKTKEWVEEIGYPISIRNKIDIINTTPVDNKLPTMGIYGKLGETKGTFDLISALHNCTKDYTLFAMINGYPKVFEKFLDLVISNEMQTKVKILPFLPHWKVPSFIVKCDIIAFLERDFSISFHGPIIPREVMACGRCLVCSREIVEKISFKDNLINLKNIIVIEDPKQINDLAFELSKIIDDIPLSQGIGFHGYGLSKNLENWNKYKNSRVDLLEKCLSNSTS